MCQQQICAISHRIQICINIAQMRNDQVADGLRSALGIHHFLKHPGYFVRLVRGRHVRPHRTEIHSISFHLLAIDFGRGDHGPVTASLQL